MSFLRRSVRQVVGPLAALAAAAFLVAPPLHAQAPRAGRTLLSLNPLGLPFKYVSGEVEQKLSPIATLGGSISYLDVDDNSYTSYEAKFRLYPNEEAFKGFSIGIAGGITRVSESYSDQPDRSETAPTIAVIADYNWLLGKTKRVVVGTGVGAKRIFGDDDEFIDANFAYPTVRFQIGVIF